MTDEEKSTREITFEIDTDNPRRVLLTIISEEFDLDGDDLVHALSELVRLVKKDLRREASGH